MNQLDLLSIVTADRNMESIVFYVSFADLSDRPTEGKWISFDEMLGTFCFMFLIGVKELTLLRRMWN